MNRKQWQDRKGHPPADLLLLHLEDELGGRGAVDVGAHIGQCEACRLACQELELGMRRFVAFRDSAVLPAPARRQSAFLDGLIRMEAQGSTKAWTDRLGGLLRIHTPARIALFCSVACLCLVAWISYSLSTPRQSVYASQLLDDARGASDALLAHSRVLNQKIRLRRGTLTIERSVHHGRQAAMQAHDASIDSELLHELALAHIDWNDPLNASDFAEWRSEQPKHSDLVQETAGSFIITTHPDGAAIREESLTLARSDLRPIARSVEVKGEAPIEINELSYDIGDAHGAKAESAIGALAPAANPTASAPAATGEGSSLDLETSELDLREALHTAGADVSARPEIWIADQTVFVHTDPRSPAEGAEIRAAVSRIPHVKETAKQLARLTEPPLPFDGSGPYATTPPLAGELQTRLGDARAVNSFVESFRDRSSRVLGEAAALDELGKRYPQNTIKTLPPGLRARVNRLAASMLSSLQGDTSSLVKALAPALNDAARDLSIPAAQEDGSNAPGCLSWQDNAALAAPQLRSLTRNVSLLLLPGHTDRPVPLSASELIANSLSAKSFLELHLMSTCQLFSAN